MGINIKKFTPNAARRAIGIYGNSTRISQPKTACPEKPSDTIIQNVQSVPKQTKGKHTGRYLIIKPSGSRSFTIKSRFINNLHMKIKEKNINAQNNMTKNILTHSDKFTEKDLLIALLTLSKMKTTNIDRNEISKGITR